MSWNTASGADNYNLIVSDVTSNTQAFNSTFASNTYTLPLTAGHQFRWQVASCNASGCSTYTAAQYFQTPSSTPALSITTTAFNPTTATVGVAYGAQAAIATTGGQAPYSCSASGLPNGMGMNSSSCAIFGAPTASGTFNVSVTVTDGSSPQKTASKVLALTVY